MNFAKTLHTYNFVKEHTLKSHVIWEMSGHNFFLHQTYSSKSSHITTVISGTKSKVVMLGSCLTDDFILHALLYFKKITNVSLKYLNFLSLESSNICIFTYRMGGRLRSCLILLIQNLRCA